MCRIIVSQSQTDPRPRALSLQRPLSLDAPTQNAGKDPKFWRSLDTTEGGSGGVAGAGLQGGGVSASSSAPASAGGRPLFRTQRSSSMPTPRSQKAPPGVPAGAAEEDEELALAPRSSRVSVSNEDNVLLDPEVLTDFPTQALVLTVLVRGARAFFRRFLPAHISQNSFHLSYD